MRFETPLAITITVLVACACQQAPKVDFEEERKAILALEAKAREHHFQKNVKDFVDGFSKDFISISRGRIDKPDYETSFKRFDSYFKSIEFIKWDDKAEPIVRFSDDASVAYVAVDKIVITEFADEKGNKVSDTTNFAWLSVYKKLNGEWKLDCIASTNK